MLRNSSMIGRGKAVQSYVFPLLYISQINKLHRHIATCLTIYKIYTYTCIKWFVWQQRDNFGSQVAHLAEINGKMFALRRNRCWSTTTSARSV